MCRNLLTACLGLCLSLVALSADRVAVNCGQLASALKRLSALPESFNLTARVSDIHTGEDFAQRLVLQDSTGHAFAICETNGPSIADIRLGDSLRLAGRFFDAHRSHDTPVVTSVVRLARSADALAVPRVPLRELVEGKHDFRPVETEGLLRDHFKDEIDPRFHYATLQDGRDMIQIAWDVKRAPEVLPSLHIGARLSACGIRFPQLGNEGRVQLGGTFHLRDKDPIRILSDPPADPFAAAAPCPDVRAFTPSDFAQFERQKVSGRVVAVWRPDAFLLATRQNGIMKVNVAETPLPRYGDCIEALGFPETDTYHINLMRAVWRPCRPLDIPEPPAVRLTLREMTTDARGERRMRYDLHGRAVRLRGLVRSLPSLPEIDGRMFIQDGRDLVSVDASATPKALKRLTIGDEVEVAGTCVMDIENWRPNEPSPRIRGFMLVVRTAHDIRLLNRPPWLTPRRLQTSVGAFCLALVAIVLWNVSLKRASERRGRKLAHETAARITSELKVYERTRLAVELHDSIVQNLTGVALEIDAADRLRETDLGKMHAHLTIAAQALQSCRDELRDCLWDLHNAALEEEDINLAIRKTLAPHVGEAVLSVRFDVPRAHFTDNMTHTILRIVRELASNAVRHGGATALSVVGAIKDGCLVISVTDNGCGFDPSSCPGMAQGHFGLQGVRERVENLNGSVRIESAHGKGTTVTVSIDIFDANAPKKGIRHEP